MQSVNQNAKASFGWLRSELVFWFGAIGLALTIYSKWQAARDFALFIHRIVNVWQEGITYLWQHFLFFLPHLSRLDAALFTSITFGLLTVIGSTRLKTEDQHRAGALSVLALTAAIVVLGAIFFRSSTNAFEHVQLIELKHRREIARPEPGSKEQFEIKKKLLGYYYNIYWDTHYGVDDHIREAAKALHLPLANTQVYVIRDFVYFILVPLIPAFILYLFITDRKTYHIDKGVLAWRLWRINILIGLLASANLVGKMIEQGGPLLKS
jgi:hypothetical protein